MAMGQPVSAMEQTEDFEGVAQGLKIRPAHPKPPPSSRATWCGQRTPRQDFCLQADEDLDTAVIICRPGRCRVLRCSSSL
jgi:hypothetical protein